MRIGFIGGRGHHYLRQAIGKGDVIALAGDGHDPQAARDRLAQYEGAEWYDDPVALLDGFKPDVVNVGAMYGYNGDVIALALERGVPVVSDKPVAATEEQLERIKQAARGPARLATEFPFRSRPEFRAAREAVADGGLGQPILATAQKSYRFKVRPAWFGCRKDYGGTMLWVASHAIDVIEFVTGLRFRRVCGIQGNLSRPDYAEMEDHCVLIGEMDSGATALVHADYLQPQGSTVHGDDRLRVAASKGIVEVRDSVCRRVDDDAERAIEPAQPIKPVGDALLDAVLGRDESLYGTAASLRTAALLLACRRAADRQAWVEIPAGA